MRANEKSILIINVYQIPEGTSKEILTVKAQLDKVSNFPKLAKVHWMQILKDLIKFIADQKATDMVIAEDVNESISSKEIKQFMINIGLIEVH